jgi:Flagellar P-ring protein
MKRYVPVLLICALLMSFSSRADDTLRKALIRDVASVEGIRDNPVLGYGVVVGLRNTGDKQQTLFHESNSGKHSATHGSANAGWHDHREECCSSLCHGYAAPICAAGYPP